MTMVDEILRELTQEAVTTRRVLERVPAGQDGLASSSASENTRRARGAHRHVARQHR